MNGNQEQGGPGQAGTVSEADRKRTMMSWLMVGSGAVIALGLLLPWATSVGESASGVSLGLGWFTLLGGIGLCLYGSQGLGFMQAKS